MMDIGKDLQNAYEEGYKQGQEDRPKGEWIAEDEYGDLWVCDQCGCASEHNDNFCPNCGADMRPTERSEE